ncbi:MAG TPA: beta-N-acetylhexosaminidase, partial [Microbacterium sp.]|nr:beta-N-acetylhexosaminidase [Microbacterium sp.]
MPVHSLVPAPTSLQTGDSPSFALTGTVAVTGETDAAATLSRLVTARTTLTLATAVVPADRTIDLRVDPSAGTGGPESYRLTADEASVVVVGADAAGLFYGVQTLVQLIARDGDGWSIPAVTIDDRPRFPYRGVMLDVARHFHPEETVKAYIDRAAGLKFNALHLHLTDDQGWRLALRSRPRLTELAAGSSVGGDPGGFFTAEDYREIVAYAASRHMIVVPEIDVPGHTHAVGLAYPELAEAPVLSAYITEFAETRGERLPTEGVPYDGMAVGFSSLKIHDEATYDFLADVLGELAGLT